jgi:transcriptional regulator with XRE-family HTH domain
MKNRKEKTLTPHEIREVCGLTQEQMALLSGVDRSTYAHWEIGRRPMPEGVKKLMIDVMHLLSERTPEESRLLRQAHEKHEETWKKYFLGRLYHLIEELEHVRARRDKAVRLYHLRQSMAAKLEASQSHRTTQPKHLNTFCKLAQPQLKQYLHREQLEEILRLELSVATLQFQIRQLKQWVDRGALSKHDHLSLKNEIISSPNPNGIKQSVRYKDLNAERNTG